MFEYLEDDYRQIDPGRRPIRCLTDSRIELVGDVALPCKPRHALFDFDGTLSLVREGWPQVMIPMLVEVLQATGTPEPIASLRADVTKFVMELNGKQTIYQMIRLAEEIQLRGGQPEDPLSYKAEYHQRLMRHISSRRNALRSGDLAAEKLLVPGSVAMLEGLSKRGVQLYLASGTDEQYVREEVELLGLAPFFGGHVYGAVDDYRTFSKARVIERILKENNVPGDALVGFGDGYVEIQNVRDVGGTAVAVASDEAGRSGIADSWKRERLIGAGAQLVIPDFAEADRFLTLLFDGPLP